MLYYIHKTLYYGLKYSKSENREPTVYTDSDFTGSTLLDGRKSTSGYIIYLAGAPIIWSLKRQTATATSTIEAEYIGQFNAIKHMVHMGHFLIELSIPYSLSMTLYADNQAA